MYDFSEASKATIHEGEVAILPREGEVLTIHIDVKVTNLEDLEDFMMRLREAVEKL